MGSFQFGNFIFLSLSLYCYTPFLSFFLPVRLYLRGGHQTGFGIQVHGHFNVSASGRSVQRRLISDRQRIYSSEVKNHKNEG